MHGGAKRRRVDVPGLSSGSSVYNTLDGRYPMGRGFVENTVVTNRHWEVFDPVARSVLERYFNQEHALQRCIDLNFKVWVRMGHTPEDFLVNLGEILGASQEEELFTDAGSVEKNCRNLFIKQHLLERLLVDQLELLVSLMAQKLESHDLLYFKTRLQSETFEIKQTSPFLLRYDDSGMSLGRDGQQGLLGTTSEVVPRETSLDEAAAQEILKQAPRKAPSRQIFFNRPEARQVRLSKHLNHEPVKIGVRAVKGVAMTRTKTCVYCQGSAAYECKTCQVALHKNLVDKRAFEPGALCCFTLFHTQDIPIPTVKANKRISAKKDITPG
mmetsp:Transcript_21502/g.37999  ORF Transcript_21502/g.37999 Transcript_21502/m.37999 type:complete len:327 (+) Transcript_21502:99-1079(+)|eukprot:CAMPEP_0184542950 /NCGR_PEP_ID=MMETSP0199_2-20130426/2557_1 /TAXON_ID=1112570 /ORGANISM="Thraustochytrium sp., Strain LLF1b" /LENGTH=326 /DNA_ID=CAMNT_0026936905 /DNA_START=21 /DNA_END=1001 /DNA_ORIENTATION=+